MNKFWLILAAMLWTVVGFAQNHPFPQHTNYTAGAIKPNRPQAELDSATGSFYDAWKKHYLVSGCGKGEYYIFYNRDGTATPSNAVSCSEMHAVGMIVTILMAGRDADAQKTFDGLFAYYRKHPAAASTNLMGWQQITNCVESENGDDTVSDGDVDIAYALLLADAQWGSSGKINYLEEGKKVVAAIRQHEVNPALNTFRLGAWAVQETWGNSSRLSTYAMNHLRHFERAANDPSWSKVIDKGYALLQLLQGGSKVGLVPDFVINLDSTNTAPAGPNFLESKHDGNYHYNSSRVPFRLGVDYLLSGDVRAKSILQRMNEFVIDATKSQPKAIRSGYNITTGKPLRTNEFSITFAAPFAVGAMIDPKNQAWLDGLWEQIVATPLAKNDYYGNSLKLLSMFVLSGNWWGPGEAKGKQ